MKIGDSVEVPAPVAGTDDTWHHAFEGTVRRTWYDTDSNTEMLDVVDQDDDVFSVEAYRVTSLEEETDEPVEGEFLEEDNGATLYCDNCRAQVRSNAVHTCPPALPFRRFQVLVEVIYDPYVVNIPNLDLQGLAYQITHGDCSGSVTQISDEGIDRKQAAALLELQGSDASFLLGEEAPTPWDMFNDATAPVIQRDDELAEEGQTDDTAALSFVKELEQGTRKAITAAEAFIKFHGRL